MNITQTGTNNVAIGHAGQGNITIHQNAYGPEPWVQDVWLGKGVKSPLSKRSLGWFSLASGVASILSLGIGALSLRNSPHSPRALDYFVPVVLFAAIGLVSVISFVLRKRLKTERPVALPRPLRSLVPQRAAAPGAGSERFWWTQIKAECPTCPAGPRNEADVRLVSMGRGEDGRRRWEPCYVCRRYPRTHRGPFDLSRVPPWEVEI